MTAPQLRVDFTRTARAPLLQMPGSGRTVPVVLYRTLRMVIPSFDNRTGIFILLSHSFHYYDTDSDHESGE